MGARSKHHTGPLLSPQLVTSVEKALKAAAHVYRRATQIAMDSSKVDPYEKEKASREEETARAWVISAWQRLNTESDEATCISTSQLKKYLDYKSEVPFKKYLTRISFLQDSTKISRRQALVIKGLKATAIRECDLNRKANKKDKIKKRTKMGRVGNAGKLEILITAAWTQAVLQELEKQISFGIGALQAFFSKKFPDLNLDFKE